MISNDVGSTRVIELPQVECEILGSAPATHIGPPAERLVNHNLSSVVPRRDIQHGD
jgi:hypothetical protein